MLCNFLLFRRVRRSVVILLPMFLLGCDGSIAIHGKVYAWSKPDMNTTSRVFETDPALKDKSLVPLPEAHVLLFRSQLAEQGKTEAWMNEISTDKTGSFETGGACAPGREDFSIQVGKDKYESVTYKFTTQTGDKALYIVLKPSARKD